MCPSFFILFTSLNFICRIVFIWELVKLKHVDLFYPGEHGSPSKPSKINGLTYVQVKNS